MDTQQAHEDLRFIRQMLEETRQRVADNGLHYINWSIMPALGIIGTYGILSAGGPPGLVPVIWAVVITLGWLFSYLLARNAIRRAPMTFAERMLVSVWVASGISMALIAFGGMFSGAFSPHVIPALVAVVMGIPYFIVSLIYQNNWFRLISAGWWAAGVAFFFWDSFHTLAALGVLIILFQAVPGLYLYKTAGRALEERPG